MTTPDYYIAPHSRLDRPLTGVDVINGWRLDYWLGSAVVHILRAGRKPGETRLQALENAAACLALAIAAERGPQ